jgi:cystathionine beta-synthase
VIQVSDRSAFLAARELARTEAIFAGGSSGAALWGVREVARRMGDAWAEEHGRPARLVTLFPDSGHRYLSTIFNDGWMRERGFLD